MNTIRGKELIENPFGLVFKLICSDGMNPKSIAGIQIPDSKLANAARELVRDTEPPAALQPFQSGLLLWRARGPAPETEV